MQAAATWTRRLRQASFHTCTRVRAGATQSDLWREHRFATVSGRYEITGPLREDALQRALHAVVARHPALRTTFTREAGQLWQQIAHESRSPLVVTDLTRVPAADAAGELERRIAGMLAEPMDPAWGPPLRAVLFRKAGGYTLVLTGHRMVFDAWSFELLQRDLGVAYGDPAFAGEELGFLDACRAGNLLPAANPVAEAVAPPALPFRVRPAHTPVPRTEQLSLRLSPRAGLHLRDLARSHGTSPLPVFVAAFAATVGRYSEADEVLVGMAVDGRDSEAAREAIGPFARVVPLRCPAHRPGGDFDDTIRRTAAALAEAALSEVTLAEPASAEAALSEPALSEPALSQALSEPVLSEAAFRALAVPRVRYEPVDAVRHPLRLAGCEVSGGRVPGFPGSELELLISETAGRFEVTLTFDPDLIARERVQALLVQYLARLGGVEPATVRPREFTGTPAETPAGTLSGAFASWYAREQGLGPGDRCAVLAEAGREALLGDILLPGLVVHHPPASARWLAGAAITVVHATTSMLRLIASARMSLPLVRLLCLGGSPLTRDDYDCAATVFPNARIIGVYGCAAGPASMVDLSAEYGPSELPPLGDGTPFAQLLAVDSAGRPMPVNGVGEVAVRSPHLPPGHLPDPFGRPGVGLLLTGDRARVRPDLTLELQSQPLTAPWSPPTIWRSASVKNSSAGSIASDV